MEEGGKEKGRKGVQRRREGSGEGNKGGEGKGGREMEDGGKEKGRKGVQVRGGGQKK